MHQQQTENEHIKTHRAYPHQYQQSMLVPCISNANTNEQTIKIRKTIKRSVYKIDFPETINRIYYRIVPHEQPFPPF